MRGVASLTIVVLISFDETPAVDIDDHALVAPLGPQDIEPTDALTEPFAYLSRPSEFLVSQSSDKPVGDVNARFYLEWSLYLPNLFAFCVPSNQAIDYRRFSCLGMRVTSSDSIYLDIFSCGHLSY